MSRPLRIELANGLYHVTTRGWERRVIVADDRDRENWLRLLDRVATRMNWRVFSWVLMDNHFHLYLRTPQANLSAGMHDLNSGYASMFNRRHRRVGSLYQGRFKGILVEDDSYALGLSRYLHLNPVRAKMVARPEEYRWSSYRAYRYCRDAKQSPPWLDWKTVLHEHSRNLANARRAYQRFVENGIDNPPSPPLAAAVGGLFLGSTPWLEKIRERLDREPRDPNVPTRQRFSRHPKSSEIFRVVGDQFAATQSTWTEKRRHGKDARNAAIYLVRHLTAEPVTTIAKQFGNVSLAAISKSVKRSEMRRAEDARWNRLLAKLEKQCLKKNVKLNVKT